MREQVSFRPFIQARAGRTAVMVLLASSLGGVARAQTPAPAKPAPDRFDLSLALGERSTSNPAFQPDNQSPDGDYVSDLRADLAGARKTQRTDWSLHYRPFYTRYRVNDQFDTSNHALDWDGSYRLSRLTNLKLLERFSYSRDPIQVASPETGDSPVLTRQTKRWRNAADAGVDLGLSRSVSFLMGAFARVDRYQDPGLADTNTYTGRVGVLDHLGRQDRLATTYSYSRFLLNSDAASDVSSHGLDVEWSHGAPGRTELGLSVGLAEVFQSGARQNRFTGGASFHRPFRHADFVTGYRRSLSADTGVASVTLAQNAYAGFSGGLGRRVTLGLVADYGTRKSALTEGTDVDLSYAGGTVRGSVTLNERFSLTGEASRRRQNDAVGVGSDVTADIYFLGLAFKIF